MIRVVLPWPPSTNRLWRSFKKKGVVALAAPYKRWKKEAGEVLSLQRPVPVSCPVAITLRLTPPNARRYDLDNRIKSVLDLLVDHCLIADDDNRTLKELHVYQRLGDEPGVVVEVAPITC